ncbi:MAG TPA: carbonic anhydrase [Acidobacteriaceae bacterium]|nr:carbonic anhydrase [Acidobacteriaceae bacterium]
MEFLEPEVLLAQTNLTPDESLQHLMEGNQRFAADKLGNLGQSLNILRKHTVEKQEPFAAVLSCADSRVPVELVFDQTIGQIFVTRVAGNFVTPEIIGSLEYGAAVLGTKVILVLGHSSCGAVKATMQGKPVPGQISSLFSHIQPAVDIAHGNLETAIKENAKIQAGLLADSSPVLSEMVSGGKLKIVAGYYDLASGRVSILS